MKLDTFPLSNDVGLLNRYEPFGQREYIVFQGSQITRSFSTLTLVMEFTPQGLHGEQRHLLEHGITSLVVGTERTSNSR